MDGNLLLYLQLQSVNAAEKSVDSVRRIQRILKSETGLQTIASADSQVRGMLAKLRLYVLSQNQESCSNWGDI